MHAGISNIHAKTMRRMDMTDGVNERGNSVLRLWHCLSEAPGQQMEKQIRNSKVLQE